MPLIENASPPVVIAARRKTLVRVLNPFLFGSKFGQTQVYFNRAVDSFVKALPLTDNESLLATKFQVRQSLSMQDIVQGMQRETVPGEFMSLYDRLRSNGVDVPPTKPGRKKRMSIMTQVVTLSAARRSLSEISKAVELPLSELQREVKPLLRRVLVEEDGQWRPTLNRIRVFGETEEESGTYARIRQTVLHNAVYSKASEK